MSGKEAPNSRRLSIMVNGREGTLNFLHPPRILHPVPPPSMTSTLMLKVLTRLHQRRFTPLNLKFTSPKPTTTRHRNLIIFTPPCLKLTPHPLTIRHLLLKSGLMPPTNTNSNIHRHPCWKSGLTLAMWITTRSRALKTLLSLHGLLKPTIRITSSIPRFSPI